MSENIKIVICKADPIGSETVPDTYIAITAKLPLFKSVTWMVESEDFYDEQARELEEALMVALPGAVYDRLLGHMLAGRARSYLRVALTNTGQGEEAKR